MSAIWSTALSRDRLLDLRAISGELQLAVMPRVKAATAPGTGSVTVSMQFSKQNSLLLIDGTVKGSVYVQCQRCLEPLPIELDNVIRVALSEHGDGGTVPQGYEAVLAENDGIVLSELVEDEILLSVPLSARHEIGQCGALADKLKELGAVEQSSEGARTPFAGLDDLLKKRN